MKRRIKNASYNLNIIATVEPLMPGTITASPTKNPSSALLHHVFFIVFYQRFPQIFLHANFLYRIYLLILYIDYTKLAPFCQGEKRNIFPQLKKFTTKITSGRVFFGCFTVILCVFRAVFCVIFAEKTRFSSLFCTFLRRNYSKIQEKRG